MKLVRDLGLQYPTKNSKHRYRYGLFECPDCGKHIRSTLYSVIKGKSTRCKGCGMKKTQLGLIKHGGCTEGISRLYNIWNKIKKRCNNKNDARYGDYGGRGIVLDPVWEVYEIFRDWALSNGYEDHLTIDRKDNDGDYTPGNCRWATYKQQNNNTRVSILNRFSVDELSEACEYYYHSSTSIKKLSLLMGIGQTSVKKLLSGGYSCTA